MILSEILDERPGKGVLAVELDAGRKEIIPGFGTFGTTYPSRQDRQESDHRSTHGDPQEDLRLLPARQDSSRAS